MDFEYKLMLIAKDASEEGFEEGYKEGFEKGYKEGFEEERREVRLSNYSSLVQDGVLSLSDAISLSDRKRLNIWYLAFCSFGSYNGSQ